MMDTSMRSCCLGVALMAAGAAPAYAQTYPAKAIRVVVSFAPGGATDTFARLAGAQLTERLGQQVIVENRPGAGTTIAAELVSRAAPDGYTLLFTDLSTHVITGSLYQKLAYDPRDFAAVSLVASSPMIIAAHPSLNARTVKDMIATAQRHGEITYGSSGTGTVTHLSMERLKSRAGVPLTHVPFKGGTTSVTSVLTGDTALAIATVPAVLPHVKTGRLVAVAVTSGKRAPQLPDVPAIAETLPDFDTAVHNGVLAPAKTPRDIVERLNAEFNRAMEGAKAKDVLTVNAAYATPLSTGELQQMILRESNAWAAVVKASGLQAN